MRETIMTVRDERIMNYSVAFSNALELERDIKRQMREGEKTVYLTIRAKTSIRSLNLEIGSDLLQIAQGAAFGAYRELAFKPDRQTVKETGEKRRVVDKDGKETADDIVNRIKEG